MRTNPSRVPSGDHTARDSDGGENERGNTYSDAVVPLT
jgi:hypothetical protein